MRRTATPTRGAGIEPFCEVLVACRSLLPLASALGLSIVFAVGCHLAGLVLSADAPLVVWRRQRRSALLVCVGLLLLHPPTLVYFFFTDSSCTHVDPPQLVTLCEPKSEQAADQLQQPSVLGLMRLLRSIGQPAPFEEEEGPVGPAASPSISPSCSPIPSPSRSFLAQTVTFDLRCSSH